MRVQVYSVTYLITFANKAWGEALSLVLFVFLSASLYVSKRGAD